MDAQFELNVVQSLNNFQQYSIVEMIFQWIGSSDDPQALLNELLAGWRERQQGFFDQQAKINFERTGVIETNRGYFQQIQDEAERRIRARLAAAISDQGQGNGQQVCPDCGKRHEQRDGQTLFSCPAGAVS